MLQLPVKEEQVLETGLLSCRGFPLYQGGGRNTSFGQGAVRSGFVLLKRQEVVWVVNILVSMYWPVDLSYPLANPP